MTMEIRGSTAKPTSCWNSDSKATRQMLCQFSYGGSVRLSFLPYLEVGCRMFCKEHTVGPRKLCTIARLLTMHGWLISKLRI
jgi:hypothetical protein